MTRRLYADRLHMARRWMVKAHCYLYVLKAPACSFGLSLRTKEYRGGVRWHLIS